MPSTAHLQNPFQLINPIARASSLQKSLRLLSRPLTHVAGLDHCAKLYADLPLRGRVSQFAEHSLAKLGVGWTVDASSVHRIPRTGATIIVANHPFGGLEGLVLLALLRKIRPDVRVLANPILGRIPELRDCVIPIDPFQTSKAKKRNVSPLRQAFAWLKQDGLIVVFPAGEVSHFHLRTREVTDPAWQPGIGHLARRSGADVLPVYFSGGNGFAFQFAGLVHPRLRTLLLPRQLVNKRGRSIDVKIGERIPAARLKSFATAQEITAYLRLRTYLLADRAGQAQPVGVSTKSTQEKAMQPLAEPGCRDTLAAEIDRLPQTNLLHTQGRFQVWCVQAEQAPGVLQEIGRLRELTFRQHDEGTGRSLDLDHFDAYYRHLFVWNCEQKEIVGAYRLGLSDEILRDYGVAGLYTHTLFRLREDLFCRLGPTLELGRSFVRPEYQKSFSSLLLLWQGIGRFLVHNPRYRSLFGPVSISQSYSDFSRQLMTSTLHEHLRIPELSRFVAPRLPVVVRKPRVKGCPSRLTRNLVSDLDRVNSLLADIEADGKGLPVLLRQYLNLGGRMLAFNLDPDFSNVIDGLILVDLDRTPRKTLARYLGKDGVADYLAYPQNKALARVA